MFDDIKRLKEDNAKLRKELAEAKREAKDSNKAFEEITIETMKKKKVVNVRDIPYIKADLAKRKAEAKKK